MTETYTTRHVGLAVTLRFILGDGAHLSTHYSDKGCEFIFADSGDCRSLAAQFFSDESICIGSARELLEIAREVRKTTALARANPDKVWQAGAADQM